MNTTINNGMPKFPQAPTGQSNAPAQGTAGTASSDASRAAASDHIKLTDSARALQEAARTDNSAVIDSKRVEQVRLALANGSYQINPGRIADRMLSLDAQIAGTAATDKV